MNPATRGAVTGASVRTEDSAGVPRSRINGSPSQDRLRRRLPAFLALTDQGVTSTAAFLGGVLVARATSPSAFGIYTLVSVTVVWAVGAHAALVTTPYTYQQTRCPPARRPAYSGNVLLHHWFLCVLVAVVMTPLIAVSVGGPSPSLLVPIGIVVVGALIRDYLRATYYAHAQIGRAFLINCGIVSMQIGGLIVLWGLGHVSVPSALLAMGLPPLLVAIPLQFTRARQSQFDLGDGMRQLQASWSFGKWLLAGLLINALSRDAFPWLLASIHGVETTGRYAAHLNIALLVNPAVIGISNYIAPSFARTNHDGGSAALMGRVRSTALVIGGAMLVYSFLLLLWGGALSAVIYGHRLRASGPIIAILALGLTARAFSTPYGIALYALDRADINIKAAAAALAVSLVVGIPAMIALGVAGAALVYLLSTLVEHSVKWFMLRRLRVATSVMISHDASE